MAGVIRLTVYDYTTSPPRVLAERWVYRQPRRLVVRAAEEKKPGGKLSLSIQNEKGRPVAAALGLTVLEGGKDTPSSPDQPAVDARRRPGGESGLRRRAVVGPICCTHSCWTATCRTRPRWRASI